MSEQYGEPWDSGEPCDSADVRPIRQDDYAIIAAFFNNLCDEVATMLCHDQKVVRRIVACVNVCARLPLPDDVETGTVAKLVEAARIVVAAGDGSWGNVNAVYIGVEKDELLALRDALAALGVET